MYRREGPPTATSVTTGVVLIGRSAAYLCVGPLYFAAASSLVVGALWLALAATARSRS